MNLLTTPERVTRRASLGVLVGALAVAAAACADGGATTTRPSSVAPANFAAGKPADTPTNDRNFTVTISPSTISSGVAADLTVTITNVNANSSQKLATVQVAFPVDVNSVAFVSGAHPWSANSSGNTVTFGEAPGNNKLDNGESVQFTVNVTGVLCNTYSFSTPLGSNEAPATFDPATANWTFTGAPLAITVIGCSEACNDRHAPAVANDYVKNVLNIAPNEIPGSIYGALIREIGQQTAEDGTFQGLSPCDHPAYENAVIAFITDWIATHES